MTYKEAIGQLRANIYGDVIDDFDLEAFELAIKALEKQIPKKPTKLDFPLLIESGWIYKCPACGCACGENKYHLEVTQDDYYCTQCGQALDWSDTE